MKKFFVILLSILMVLAVVSCDSDAGHPEEISKDQMKEALGEVSDSLDEEKGTITAEVLEPLYRETMKVAVDALQLILDCADVADVNYVGSYRNTTSAEIDDTTIFFGTSGKVKFSYAGGIIEAAITNETSNNEAMAYLKLDFDFAKNKINSFEADFMRKSAYAATSLLLTLKMDGEGTISSSLAWNALSTPEAVTNFYNDVYTPIKNTERTSFINLNEIVTRIKESDIAIDKDDFEDQIEDICNMLDTKGTANGTITATIGSTDYIIKYSNGVLSIGTSADGEIYYIENNGNNSLKYYWKDNTTWYTNTAEPAGLKAIVGATKASLVILRTVEDAVFYHYNFDQKTFSFTYNDGTSSYSFSVELNTSNNISKIGLTKDGATIASLSISDIGSTTISGLTSAKINAQQV